MSNEIDNFYKMVLKTDEIRRDQISKNIEEQKNWDAPSWDDFKDGEIWSDQFGGTDKLWDDLIYGEISPYLKGDVLEIACGHGRMSSKIQKFSERLYLMDVSNNCVDYCKKRFSDKNNIFYFVNDGDSLPQVKDNSIDFIFSWDSFVHMQKFVIENYLKEISKKLKDGGVGAIHHSYLLGGDDVYSYKNIQGRSTFTPKLFDLMCRKYGLEIISQKIFTFNSLEDVISVFKKKNFDSVCESKIFGEYRADDIFIIGAYADTEYKLDILKGCIQKCRCTKRSDILLVSHFPVPTDIQNSVDYYIYDCNNSLLLKDEYSLYGVNYNIFNNFNRFSVRYSMPYKHDYSVFCSMREAFNFSNHLGKKYIYYTEYDVDIDENMLSDNELTNENNKKVCVHNFCDSAYSTNFFSIRVEEAIMIFNKILSKDQFFSIYKYNKFVLFESLFFYVINENIPNENIFINEKRVVEKMSMSYNFCTYSDDGWIKASVFCCKDKENTIYVIINNYGGCKKNTELRLSIGDFVDNISFRDEGFYLLNMGKEEGISGFNILDACGKSLFNRSRDDIIEESKDNIIIFREQDT